MGVRVQASRPAPRPRAPGPGAAATLFVFVATLVLLLANGRPIGAPDPRGAAGWLWRGALALAGAGGLELDATGQAVVGKLLAAAFAAAAAAALFAAVARRHTAEDARWAAFALALGTTLAAAAQTWSGEAPAAAAVALALWLIARAEDGDDPTPAARAGLPLALAGALQPTAVPLALVLAIAIVVRWRHSGPALLAWTASGAIVGIVGLAAAAPGAAAVAAPADPAPLALLASPAKGVLVFAPVVLVGLVGLVRALRSQRASRLWDQPEPRRPLPAACALAFVAHVAAVVIVGGWSAGVSWGPRLLAPAFVLLLLFLPEGLEALRFAGTLLVVASVAVQALGALTYDGRWDRLVRGADGRLGAAAWDLARSPLAFQWHERVARPSLLGFEGRRLVVREHALVRGSATGSFVSFAGGGLRPTGADATMESLRLEQGARVAGDRLELHAAGDGLAFRVREGARPRRLEVRVIGRGQGTLGVAEKAFWGTSRLRERAVSGAFRVRFPYAFAETRAADLAVTLRAGGPLSIESVALVPPGEPEDVIRLP